MLKIKIIATSFGLWKSNIAHEAYMYILWWRVTPLVDGKPTLCRIVYVCWQFKTLKTMLIRWSVDHVYKDHNSYKNLHKQNRRKMLIQISQIKQHKRNLLYKKKKKPISFHFCMNDLRHLRSYTFIQNIARKNLTSNIHSNI